jgi:RHS repeat-associated protein
VSQTVQEGANTTTTVFVSAGARVVAEYAAGQPLSQPLRKYAYGPYVDQPIALIVGPVASEAVYHYHANGSFSVAALTDANGVVVERYAYSAYGEPLILDATATTVRPASVVGNRYLFTGREWDHATATYHYRARAYDPRLGRFLSRDPLDYAAGMSLYEYVGGRPLDGLDPSGLIAWWLTLEGWGAFDGAINQQVGEGIYNLATGQAGHDLGQHGYDLGSTYAGHPLTEAEYDGSQGLYVVGAMLGQIVGTNSLVEGTYGVDLVSGNPIHGMDRTCRTLSGAGGIMLVGAGPANLTPLSRVRVNLCRSRTPPNPAIPPLPPPPLRFTQTTASPWFSPEGNFAGQTISDVSTQLQSGVLTPVQLPIEVVVSCLRWNWNLPPVGLA